MRKVLMLVAAVSFALLSVSTVLAGERVIVRCAPGTTHVEMRNVALQNGAAVINGLPLINGIVITLPPQASDRAREAIAAHVSVVGVEDDAIVTANPKPDKPPKPPKDDPPEEEPPLPEALPWGVDRIDAEWAWDTSTGFGIKVAVIDTGIDLDHPDLVVVGNVNMILSRKSGDDDNGHGTHCAGTIAALDNELGVVGVAPQANLYAVKVLDRKGSGWLSDVIAGLDWCVANDMDVASMSLGGGYSSSFEDACANAYTAGLVMVAAAGNSGDAVGYPAAYAEVIAVSATGDYENQLPSDNLASFSCYGPEIDFAAPGVAILSTYKGGEYKELNGTSMACPHVAGAVALVLQVDGDIGLLYSTADDIGLTVEQQGNGLVDAEEAATGSETGDDLP